MRLINRHITDNVSGNPIVHYKNDFEANLSKSFKITYANKKLLSLKNVRKAAQWFAVQMATQEEPQTPKGAFEARQNEPADFFVAVQGE
jgi:hypothetical protein